jgi:DNA repair and recombination RAD54-like protein
MRTFRKTLANPILRGREPDASPEERESAEEKLKVVSEVTEQFILRRTNRLNARFLPPKKLFNVFVAPSEFQRRLYHCFLKSNVARKVLQDADKKVTASVFTTIKRLQKLVNHPFLVRSAGFHKLEAGFDDEEAQNLFAEVDALDKGLRNQQRPVRQELSGKMELLYSIMKQIQASKSGDRIVIISNWTSTLDLVEKMCEHNRWPVHRLDGTTSTTKRMKLVTDFNLPGNPQAFAFLLSSKAGGCGLNLIGANRLVMYDPDWNPANDRQAMARIWRDGQKKPCFIYRLFTTGTIDEKVYQRQICKDGLSTMMVNETGDEENTEMVRESLAADLVKDLFTFAEGTPCATHDMLQCKRCVACTRGPSGVIDVGGDDDEQFVLQEAEVIEDELCTWSHHADVQGVPDDILTRAHRQCTGKGVTFTMGCHIEFSEETIKRLEEEERALQKEREAKATKTADAPASTVAPKQRGPDAEESAELEEQPPQNPQPKAASKPSPAVEPSAPSRKGKEKKSKIITEPSIDVQDDVALVPSPARQQSSATEGEAKRRRFTRLRPQAEISRTCEQVIGCETLC